MSHGLYKTPTQWPGSSWSLIQDRLSYEQLVLLGIRLRYVEPQLFRGKVRFRPRATWLWTPGLGRSSQGAAGVGAGQTGTLGLALAGVADTALGSREGGRAPSASCPRSPLWNNSQAILCSSPHASLICAPGGRQKSTRAHS